MCGALSPRTPQVLHSGSKDGIGEASGWEACDDDALEASCDESMELSQNLRYACVALFFSRPLVHRQGLGCNIVGTLTRAQVE